MEPNHIYVIPPNTRLGIARGQLKVQPREPTRAGVRSIDSFFEALAAEKHAAAIGVILSGTATDGTMGLEAIKAEGGITFAQNESARYDSMPRSAVAAGCVDFVLSPKQIAIELARIARHPYVQLAAAATGHSMSSPSGAETQGDSARMAEEGEAPSLATDGSRGQPRLRAASEDEAFKKILLLVRNHSGVDFSLYKTNTIQRRIRRRMILHKLENVGAFVSGVIAHVQEREREVRDKDGRWFLLRVRPYFTIENKVDGAVLVLVDITDRKKIEQEVVAAREYAEATIRTARDPLVVLRADLRVNTANEAFYRKFATTPEKTEGRLVFEICDGAWEIPPLRDLLESILPQRRVFNDYEVSHEFPDLGRRTMLLNARQLEQTENAAPMILLAIEDVTEKQHAAEVAAAFAAIVNSSDDAIVSKSLDGIINTWNEVAERLFGYSAQEAIGQPITLIIPPDRLEEEPKILSRIKRGEPVLNFETVRVRKDGTPVEISLTVSPNGDFVTVRAIQQGVITASDGRSIDTARVRHLSHGYAVTSHKSQSKTADHVIVAAERLNQKSAYVACSRGRLSCSVHAPDKANLLACLADGERPAAVEVLAKEMRKETVQPRDKAWPALNRVRAPARTPLQRAMSFEWWRETLRQWCHPVPGHFGPNTNRQDRTR